MIKRILLRILLVLVGLAAQCVKSAALASHNRGYRVAVISDTEELKAGAIEEFREMGLEILELD